MPPNTTPPCRHHNLILNPSSHAERAGYKRHTLGRRIAATTPQGTVPKPSSKQKENASTFPAPLVLLGDELSRDPKYPAQSLRSWIREKDRNAVTPEQRTVYFVALPDFGPGLEFAREWARPRLTRKEERAPFPRTEEVLEYLQAFYHGLPVKMLPGRNVCFTADVDVDDSVMEISPPSKRTKKSSGKSTAEKLPMLWLNTHTASGCIGIRTRATPKGAFSHQLNLNDLLDAPIEILPEDAYALLMLVEHDIYEDEEDDFACGRAYGGSRVAVVSGARYDPALDVEQKVPRSHGWPASHCDAYMQSCVEEAAEEEHGIERKHKKLKKAVDDDIQIGEGSITPMQAALSAHMSLQSLEQAPSIAALGGLWLGRVCRTASHELGHCFGIDHCVYYACAMQGTASVIEDSRQPPYLCPIDLAKVLIATGANERGRYRKLLEFCERHKEAHLFQAFGAWIQERIGE